MLLPFILLIFVIRCSAALLNPAQQQLILSLNNNLYIKHVIVIKNDHFPNFRSISSFVKHLSQKFIYISFYTVNETEECLSDYLEDVDTNDRYMYERKKTLHPIKTMVLIEKYMIEIFFTVENEYAVTKFIWVMFDDKIENTSSFYIPYNCEFLIIPNQFEERANIFDMYHNQIYSDTICYSYFGMWKKEGILKTVEHDIYQRRFNRQGTKLTVISEFTPENWKDTEIAFFEIISHTSKMMNFSINVIPFDEYTTLLEKTDYKLISWEIFLLPYGYGYALTTRDWYGPFWKTSVHFYIRFQTAFEGNEMLTYLRPFAIDLWQAVLYWTLITGLCITLKIYFSGEYSFTTVLTGFYQPIEALLNKCNDDVKPTTSYQIATTTMRIGAMFLNPAYTGAILSFILLPNIKLPFENIERFVKDGSYKMGFANDSNFIIYFMNTNDEWSKLAYEKFLIDGNKQPRNLSEGLNKVCFDSKFAFAATKLIEDELEKSTCKILEIPAPIVTTYRSILVRLRSPYRQVFNRILKTFISSGIMKRLEEKHIYPKFSLIKDNSDENEIGQVEIRKFVSLFEIIGIICTFSFLIFLFEHLWYYI